MVAHKGRDTGRLTDSLRLDLDVAEGAGGALEEDALLSNSQFPDRRRPVLTLLMTLTRLVQCI